LGTLAYSSPEQMEGKELDNRSDIYSLGVMMFEMLTGKMPLVPESHSFGGWYKVHHYKPPRLFSEFEPKLKLPIELENLVMKCLAKKPNERPQNIGEILKDLASIEERYKNSQFRTSTDIDIYKKSEAASQVETVKADFSQDHKFDINTSVSNDEILRQAIWPSDKPIADIVFPQNIQVNGSSTPALWVMLPQIEIHKRLVCTRYNQFLFITAPHPMLLWITVIYHRKFGAKWLPYYLDLKTNTGKDITTLLGETGYYRLVFFGRENPSKCSHILLSSIAPAQRQRLLNWVNMSVTLPSSAKPLFSKKLLKAEYQKIKPQIFTKLQGINTDSPFDISA
jgi:serine/threonine-protein kinase